MTVYSSLHTQLNKPTAINAAGMTFSIERHERATVVYTVAELDLFSRDAFATILNRAMLDDADGVVVNLERCTYVDSTALNVLIDANRRIGTRLSVVIPAHNPCRRFFDICGLGTVLGVSTSLEEALAKTSA